MSLLAGGGWDPSPSLALARKESRSGIPVASGPLDSVQVCSSVKGAPWGHCPGPPVLRGDLVPAQRALRKGARRCRG